MIAVIVPAHNEGATIGVVIADIGGALKGIPYHIIVTCDRCSDDTEKIARQNGAETIISNDPGLAGSFRTGVKRALEYNPEAIVHIDADGQYEPMDILKLLSLLGTGSDLAIGDRIWRRPDGMTMSKYILNHIGSLTYSLLLLTNIVDMTGGLRAFNQTVARLPLLSRYTFTQEQVWRTVKAGYKVKFARTMFYKRADGESRLMKHPMEYILRSIKDFRKFAR